MRMRMYSRLAIIGTIAIYPIIYYTWVKQMKNSWIQNDILHNHLDIIYPESNRYRPSSVYNWDNQFQEALIFSSKQKAPQIK